VNQRISYVIIAVLLACLIFPVLATGQSNTILTQSQWSHLPPWFQRGYLIGITDVMDPLSDLISASWTGPEAINGVPHGVQLGYACVRSTPLPQFMLHITQRAKAIVSGGDDTSLGSIVIAELVACGQSVVSGHPGPVPRPYEMPTAVNASDWVNAETLSFFGTCGRVGDFHNPECNLPNDTKGPGQFRTGYVTAAADLMWYLDSSGMSPKAMTDAVAKAAICVVRAPLVHRDDPLRLKFELSALHAQQNLASPVIGAIFPRLVSCGQQEIIQRAKQ